MGGFRIEHEGPSGPSVWEVAYPDTTPGLRFKLFVSVFSCKSRKIMNHHLLDTFKNLGGLQGPDVSDAPTSSFYRGLSIPRLSVSFNTMSANVTQGFRKRAALLYVVDSPNSE